MVVAMAITLECEGVIVGCCVSCGVVVLPYRIWCGQGGGVSCCLSHGARSFGRKWFSMAMIAMTMIMMMIVVVIVIYYGGGNIGIDDGDECIGIGGSFW